MPAKGYLYHFVPPPVDDMPRAANAVNITRKEFVHRILQLSNFLRITVCQNKTDFVEDIIPNQDRENSLKEPLVDPGLFTRKKCTEYEKKFP
jgi:hypothetical protein